MANYSSQFIPNFVTITEPLRQLTHKGTPFIWTQEQDHAYNTLRKALINSPRDSPSSPPNIVAYASRALTSTERRYSQTETEEALVGIEYFHLYLYGATFTLYTDHKALEVIFGNPISKPPARIERWFLRLQQYKFRVVYKSGSTNPADYLSRHPPDSKQKQTNIADKYVHFVTHTEVLPALTVDDVRKATSKDTLLGLIRTAIQTGQWSSSELKQFKPIKDELSIDYTNNVVLRGTRLVIPSSLVQGHQGQVRTKALIREHVCFPEMDKKVRAELEKCLACQATGQPSQPEPLRSTPLPNKAWDKLKIDLYGPLPTRQYILVILDCYSRFPEVEVLSSISAKTVIPELDAAFPQHGVPSQVVSDNGPPFQQGHEFNRYMT
ncbi:Retrovirus-related Pol poly from transposon [Paramuricea clavata]|uniref:Retrovirus-related Pol poly from transposon n=1 Tax=Paramuricea clavata TaxID=317549 RepID=A0A7D9IN13_PARCT|nr:Retrovirus-related Pol poly from transposon [Paramuricea clavata]